MHFKLFLAYVSEGGRHRAGVSSETCRLHNFMSERHSRQADGVVCSHSLLGTAAVYCTYSARL